MSRMGGHAVVGVDDAADTITVAGACPVTRREWELTVPLSGYVAWREGAPIQVALPGVTKELREQLVSGTTPEGWRELFPPGWDGDEDDA